MPCTVDRRDLEILALIQQDARITLAQIAERVGLSRSPCHKRILRLRNEGVILGEVAVVDPARIGLNWEVYLKVKLGDCGDANLEAFEAEVLDWPEAMDCDLVTGPFDYLIRLMVADLHTLDDLLRDRLRPLAYVARVEALLLTRRIKDTGRVPLASDLEPSAEPEGETQHP
jgi:DNA-binding Lrp family transcriptional regulator